MWRRRQGAASQADEGLRTTVALNIDTKLAAKRHPEASAHYEHTLVITTGEPILLTAA
jgi:hypothetical protein